MSTPLRIHSHPNLDRNRGLADAPPPPDELKKYTERLVKLIPAEIVGLYLAGKVAITGYFPKGSTPPADRILTESAAWIGWSIACTIFVILVRRWATSDASADVPPEWPAIGIATVSFVIWVYSLGDVFSMVWHVWDPLLATLLVLLWTFVVPAFYGRKA